MFAAETTEFWHASFGTGESLHGLDGLDLTINPALAADRPIEILTRADGTVCAALSPDAAARLDLRDAPRLDAHTLRERLAGAGLEVHDPDCLFYFSDAATKALNAGPAPAGVRPLTADDSAAFSRFQATAGPADLDEAFVELDHWAVQGAFVAGQLACVASAYPWRGSRLADIGVLTLQSFRGRGLARDVVRAISRQAFSRGFVPQYRCQPANTGSRAVAAAAGLTYFGSWEVVLQPTLDA